MTVLDEIKTTVGTLLDRVAPGVVGVGHGWGVGSGIVIGPGRVLTNAHNLRGEEITVRFADGRSEPATPLGVDVDGDLAVLQVTTGDATPVEWGEDGIEIGTPVFAVSNPGGGGVRVTFGLVSAVDRSFRGPRGRTIPGGIEHTAPLVSGSSGGPVLDAAGRLVGINTHRLGDGFYLAIPSDASLRERVERLSSGHTPTRARLGIAVAPPHVARRLRRAVGLPEADGLLVRRVEDTSPAAAAGVREGDLIVAAGGAPTPDVDTLSAAVDNAGGSLELKLLRGAEERTVTVEVGS